MSERELAEALEIRSARASSTCVSIATTQVSRRVVARVVLEQGGARGLLAFGAADDDWAITHVRAV
jgi:hypothetical protein